MILIYILTRLEEDGKVLSPEELLYRCVHLINHTHDKVDISNSSVSFASQNEIIIISVRSSDGCKVEVSDKSGSQRAGPPSVVGGPLFSREVTGGLVRPPQPRVLARLGPCQVRVEAARISDAVVLLFCVKNNL